MRANPYSDMAVAQFTDPEHGALDTVPTDAVRQAVSYFEAYLDTRTTARSVPGGGTVIAVLGDYGTGKTHLANHLLHIARERIADHAQVMYLYAAKESFKCLYLRFLNQVDRAGVRAQVNQYYADLVAESLQQEGLSDEVFSWLRTREQEPQQIVDRMGLMESALRRGVQQELLRVTENADFGRAFGLLLDASYEDSVWSWLNGANPDEVLREQGIVSQIESDADALEALAVFALLFGGRQRRFVLIIDELERVFAAHPRPEPAVMGAFQTLLEKFDKAGACLVLCGLLDLKHLLSQSVQERISHTVVMGRLSNEEVHDLMRLAHSAAGSPGLRPFTKASAGYLNRVADGNVRDVVRLCNRSYRIFDDHRESGRRTAATITQSVIEQAARDLFDSPSSEEIDGIVRRALQSTGWDFVPDRLLGARADSRVDYWVTYPGRSGGCAVLVERSLLNGDDVRKVTRRIAGVHRADSTAVPVVVVNGAVEATVAIQLRDQLAGQEPLVYPARTFADDLASLVNAVGQRLGANVDSDMGSLRQRIDQIHRQQVGFFNVVEQLSNQVDAVRSATDNQFLAIRRQLTALTNPPRADGAALDVGLPRSVEDIFSQAVDVLDELAQLDPMLSDLFNAASEDVQEDVQRRLRSTEFVRAAGLATVMRTAVLAFRSAIAEFYRTKVRNAPGPLGTETVDQLDMLCHAYDSVMEFLPTFQLDPLLAVRSWTTRSSKGNQSKRRAGVSVLANFSPRVRDAVLRLTTESGRSPFREFPSQR